MSAIETENRVQAIGVFPFGTFPPPPDGIPIPVPVGDGMTSVTRNALGDYTVLLDEEMAVGQTVLQNMVSGGKASISINGGNPRQLDVLVFDRGGGGVPAAADLDFRIQVFQVPPPA